MQDKKTSSQEQVEKKDALHRALTAIGIVMCVILIPMLIVNCTLIVKSFVHKDKVPDFGGVLPLIVLTDSMYPDIKSGDLIICRTTDAEDVEEGDVISFFDPANGTAVVTHKVIEIFEENGELFFRTQGTNNNTPDADPVPAENLVGKYTDVRIPGAGSLALFMQTTAGLIVCVILPIILLVGYDVIRRRLYEKKKGDDMAALLAELNALKAANTQNGQSANEADAKEGISDDDTSSNT